MPVDKADAFEIKVEEIIEKQLGSTASPTSRDLQAETDVTVYADDWAYPTGQCKGRLAEEAPMENKSCFVDHSCQGKQGK